MLNISAQIPPSLREADERLTAYGRWAMYRRPVKRCGSAEGAYMPGAGEVKESRREPREVLIGPDEAMRCQRALAKVPDRERIVLTVLYVPRGIHAEKQLRLLRIPARLSQQRHLDGLRMFGNMLRVVEAQEAFRRAA